MGASSEFVQYIAESFAPLGTITVGQMFGGALLKCDGKQLGIVMGDILYFRVPARLQEKYESNGSRPFQYKKKAGMVTVKAYWSVPDGLLDTPTELVEWAKEILQEK